MPTIMLRLDDAEHQATKAAAAAAHLPLATWARVTLLKALDAAPKAQPADSKPPKAVGRPGVTLDEFLDRFADERFPSGQRRYRYVVDETVHGDDERAHAENEKDLKAFKASGRQLLKDRPNLWAYTASKRHAPT